MSAPRSAEVDRTLAVSPGGPEHANAAASRGSSGAVGIALAIVVLVLLASHLVLVAGLARRGRWGRALVALVVAPLAPWWGWQAGMRAASIAWAAALGVYALGVAFA